MEIKLPELGENISSAEVTRVLIQLGETVGLDQSLIEVETDKAVVEIPSPVAGVITKIFVQVGHELKISEVFATIETGEAVAKPPVLPEKKIIEQEKPAPSGAPVLAPSLRRLARELGVDATRAEATGPGGRVTKEDIRRLTPEDQTHEPMTKVRRLTRDRLTKSWQTIPHVTQGDTADLTQVNNLRGRFSGRVEKAGGKLTVTAIVLKIAAMALKAFPKFNSSLEGDEIIYNNFCNIGVAVDTERGLLVPVIRDADKKNILEISVVLSQLSKKAREKKILPDELQGAGFTISNLGSLGTTFFTPIINLPEVAILGLGAARQTPVWSNEKFEARLILPLSLSYDHRIIDGAEAARFLRWIVSAIEEPFLIGLEG